MPIITLDGVEQRFGVPPDSWNALLTQLDAALAPRQLIVVDVRFDGLEEPAFRDAPALQRSLDLLTTVDVLSGTAAALMQRCLLEARDALDPLADAALQAGDRFRKHEVGEASERLIALSDGLSSLVGIVGAAGLALKVDLDNVFSAGRSVSALVGELSGYLDAGINAQEAGDWIALADILEYDLAPTLRRWRPMLDRLVDALGGEGNSAPGSRSSLAPTSVLLAEARSEALDALR
jgi:hypothetical protein